MFSRHKLTLFSASRSRSYLRAFLFFGGTDEKRQLLCHEYFKRIKPSRYRIFKTSEEIALLTTREVILPCISFEETEAMAYTQGNIVDLGKLKDSPYSFPNTETKRIAAP